MANGQHVWGLVLAAGDGSRLRALTTRPSGVVAPKQFCSLCGGQSLLEDAVDRAEQLTDQRRICTIVAQQHRQWWTGIERLNELPAGNVIVQPRNRGTAIGVLYSLLHIVAKDSNARVVLLPADHYVRDEITLRQSLHTALAHVEWDVERPVLLGLEPDETDLELGYILPGPPDQLEGRSVSRFIEKPGLADALSIIDAGGLWNTFIVAASAQSLINLFLPRYAPLVMEMQVILSRGFAAGSPTAAWPAIIDLYERLPYLDFSRDLLQGRESQLCVLRMPSCGWSDLGTPRRVGETLRRLWPREQTATAEWTSEYINLAAQHAHLQSQGAAPP